MPKRDPEWQRKRQAIQEQLSIISDLAGEIIKRAGQIEVDIVELDQLGLFDSDLEGESKWDKK